MAREWRVGGGTVMPWASGACHSHHPRLCLSPTVQVRQAGAEASREGGSAPSQGGPKVVVLRLAHPSLPTTAHLLGPFSVQCSLSLPPPPVVPLPRPVPPLDQSNRDPLANRKWYSRLWVWGLTGQLPTPPLQGDTRAPGRSKPSALLGDHPCQPYSAPSLPPTWAVGRV